MDNTAPKPSHFPYQCNICKLPVNNCTCRIFNLEYRSSRAAQLEWQFITAWNKPEGHKSPNKKYK